MGRTPLNEAKALALWCQALPRLSEFATRAGAATRLERDISRIRQGGSAVSACLKWLIPPEEPPDATRSDNGVASHDPWFAALPNAQMTARTGTGTYVCPEGRCGRRAERDSSGHPPICAVLEVSMRPCH